MAGFPNLGELFKGQERSAPQREQVEALRTGEVISGREKPVPAAALPDTPNQRLAFEGECLLYEDCIICEMDPGFSTLFNTGSMDLLGKCLLDLVCETARAQVSQYFARAFEAGGGEFETSMVRMNGETFTASVFINPVPQTDRGTPHWRCSLIDIARREREISGEDSFVLLAHREREIANLRIALRRTNEGAKSQRDSLTQKIHNIRDESEQRIEELETALANEKTAHDEKHDDLSRKLEYFRNLAREKSGEVEELKSQLEESRSGRIEANLREENERRAQYAREHETSRKALREDIEKQKAYYEKRIEEKNVENSRLLVRLQQREQEYRQSQSEWLTRRVQLEKETAEAKRQFSDLAEKFDQLHATHDRMVDDLKGQVAHFRDTASQLRKDIESLDEKITEEAGIHDRVQAKLREQVRRYEKLCEAQQERIGELEEDFAGIHTERENLSRELEKQRKGNEARLRDADYERGELQVRMTALKTDSAKMIEELRIERDHFRGLVEDQTAELGRLTRKIEELSKQNLEEQEQLRDKRDDLLGAVKTKAVEVETLQQELSAAKRAYEALACEMQEMQTEAKGVIEELTELVGARNQEIANILAVVSKDLREMLVSLNRDMSALDGRFGLLCQTLSTLSLEDQGRKSIARSGIYEAAEAFDEVRRHLARINLVMDGILRISRAENTPVEYERIDMEQLVSDIFDEFADAIEKAGMEVEVTELPSCVGDSSQIRRALRQIVDNALQYRRTDQTGHVRVTGWEGQDRVFYCIEDDGIGIPAGMEQQAMAMFGRCAPDRCPGEGLGLPIARRIIERHEGNLRLESRPNEGTRIFIAFPVQ